MASLATLSLLAMARTSRRWWPCGRISSFSSSGDVEDESKLRLPPPASEISTRMSGEGNRGIASCLAELEEEEEEEEEEQSGVSEDHDKQGFGVLFNARVSPHDRETMFTIAMDSLTCEQKALLLNEVSRISSGELLNTNQDLAIFLASGSLEIDLSGCSLLRPEVCKKMFTSIKSMPLTSLNISDCHPYMSGLMLSEVWGHVPRLERLEFRATSLLFNFNKAIMDLASKCANMCHIDLSLSINLSDDAVSALLAACKELTVLKVANCPRITDDAFKIQPSSSSLVELELWGNRAITDTALHRIGCNDKIHLRRLLLTGTNTTSKGLQCLNLDELQTLEMGECELFLDDIQFVLTSARNLERLDLSWCENIEDDMLSTIANNAPCLKHLDMRKCSDITDTSIEQLCLRCSHLKHLGLARCDSLGDSSVRSICSNSKKLQSLDLSWLNEVTACGIEEVMCKLSCLTSLKLEGCKPLSDSHLEMASNNLRNLREFHMGWCNSPTDDMIDALVSKLPSVIVWDYYGREHVGTLAKKRMRQ